MKPNDFIKFCESLANDDLQTVDPGVLHAIIGIGGESGELLDALKKALVYNQPLDVDNIKEEAGDLLHYLARLIKCCGWTFEQIMQANVEKLKKRYPGGYSHKAALEKKDKQEKKP